MIRIPIMMGFRLLNMIQTGNYNDAKIFMDQIGGGDHYTNSAYIDQQGNVNYRTRKFMHLATIAISMYMEIKQEIIIV